MAKERYLQELEEEIKKKNEYDIRIRDLETKESELIEVLQNTNQIEMQALEGLKKVLNGDAPDFLEESVNESHNDEEDIRESTTFKKESFRFM